MEEYASLVRRLGAAVHIGTVDERVDGPSFKDDPEGWRVFNEPENGHLRRRRHQLAQVRAVTVVGQGKNAQVFADVNAPVLYEKRVEVEYLPAHEKRKLELSTLLEYARSRGLASTPTDAKTEEGRVAALERRLAEMEAANARPIGKASDAKVDDRSIENASDGALDELIASNGIEVRANAGRRAKIAALRNNGVEFIPAAKKGGGE